MSPPTRVRFPLPRLWCIGVAALHAALSRPRYGFDPRIHRFFLIPWSRGHDTWVTSRKRWFESIRDHSYRSAGVNGLARLCGKEEDRVRFPGGPLDGFRLPWW